MAHLLDSPVPQRASHVPIITPQELLEDSQMNNLKVGLGLAALLVCVRMPLVYAAQETNDTSQTTRYVIGCLENGKDTNEFHLIGANAKWHLKSDNVRLADHVGHKVKVAGVVSNQSLHNMKEDLKAEVKSNPTETGSLT